MNDSSLQHDRFLGFRLLMAIDRVARLLLLVATMLKSTDERSCHQSTHSHASISAHPASNGRMAAQASCLVRLNLSFRPSTIPCL